MAAPLAEVERFATDLRDIVVARATGGEYDGRDETYAVLRRAVLAHPLTRPVTPEWIRDCHTLSEFWAFIATRSSTYLERREIIRCGFAPLLARLEGLQQSEPCDALISEAIAASGTAAVNEAWLKALDRRRTDPEGAITVARALMEAVCKQVLDEFGTPYDDHADLPTLYRLASGALHLSPGQHTPEVFKQVLGGCTSVVNGLGAMRNALGDAHGKGKGAPKPLPLHAALAVNLAGTMATFLLETAELRKPTRPRA
jgi:hypothetical protein